jgi:hypothetical protein
MYNFQHLLYISCFFDSIGRGIYFFILILSLLVVNVGVLDSLRLHPF